MPSFLKWLLFGLNYRNLIIKWKKFREQPLPAKTHVYLWFISKSKTRVGKDRKRHLNALFFLMGRNHIPSFSYSPHAERMRRGHEISPALCDPPLEFTFLDLPWTWHGRNVCDSVARHFMCNKKPFPCGFPSLPLPHLSSSVSFLSLCCGCQGCQCHSLTWLVFLTLHQEADREQGERVEDAQPSERVNRKKQPDLLSWRFLDYRAA